MANWPDRSFNPLTVPWPEPGNPGAIRQIGCPSAWIELIRSCDLPGAVPQIVSARFVLAQKLYAYGWMEYGFIKSGELTAVVALELALLERYGRLVSDAQAMKRKKGPTKPSANPRSPMFHNLLHFMVENDGLTDGALPSALLYGGPVVARLYEGEKEREARKDTLVGPPTTLVGIRNGLAHGDPYDGLPWGGLLELVRDLIEYAYRDMTTETRGHAPAHPLPVND